MAMPCSRPRASCARKLRIRLAFVHFAAVPEFRRRTAHPIANPRPLSHLHTLGKDRRSWTTPRVADPSCQPDWALSSAATLPRLASSCLRCIHYWELRQSAFAGGSGDRCAKSCRIQAETEAYDPLARCHTWAEMAKVHSLTYTAAWNRLCKILRGQCSR